MTKNRNNWPIKPIGELLKQVRRPAIAWLTITDCSNERETNVEEVIQWVAI